MSLCRGQKARLLPNTAGQACALNPEALSTCELRPYESDNKRFILILTRFVPSDFRSVGLAEACERAQAGAGQSLFNDSQGIFAILFDLGRTGASLSS
jgi:hypothetical protein